MQMGQRRHDPAGRPWRRPTAAGLAWWRLQWWERRYPFNDEQELLFDLPPARTPIRARGSRRERLEWAVKRLTEGYELRVGDYVYDTGFDRSRRIIRVAERALLDLYEAAVYMGVAITDAGEVDWRPTEITPEDFYAT